MVGLVYNMNRKGMTLIELLITVVFIGMILVFMFSLLNDLRDETDNNSFAYNNQVNKVDAIHEIEKDLNTYTLLGIKSKSPNKIDVDLYYLKGTDRKTANINVSTKGTSNVKYYINYKNVDGEKFSWEMKGAEIDTCGKFTIYKEVSENELNSFYFKFNIPVYNMKYHELNNKSNNNLIDDLEVTYSGYTDDLESNNDYLTSKNNGTHNVGKCTS